MKYRSRRCNKSCKADGAEYVTTFEREYFHCIICDIDVERYLKHDHDHEPAPMTVSEPAPITIEYENVPSISHIPTH